MMAFVAIATLSTLAVIGLLIRPLIRPKSDAGVSPPQLNASIYRDQLKALELEHARKGLSAAEYAAARDELQLRLLDDEAAPAQRAQTPRPFPGSARRTAWAIALALPLASAAMYGWLGAPQAIDPARAAEVREQQIVKMVDGLAARLKANPDNPEGWAMLARSYQVLGRLQEAEDAYAKVGQLKESSPDMLADYANLLAARAGGLEGKPRELIDKALALNPLHPLSLVLAGTAAYRRGDYAGAVGHWEKLLSILEPGSADAEQLKSEIADARAKGGPKASVAGQPGAASK